MKFSNKRHYKSYQTQIRLLQENSRVYLKPKCIFITPEILFIFARDGTTHWFTPYFNKILEWLLNFCDHYHELKTTSTIINFMKDLKIRKPVYTGGFTYLLNWKIPHHVLIKKTQLGIVTISYKYNCHTLVRGMLDHRLFDRQHLYNAL